MKRQLLLPLLIFAAACSGEEAFPPPARLAIPAEAVLAYGVAASSHVSAHGPRAATRFRGRGRL